MDVQQEVRIERVTVRSAIGVAEADRATRVPVDEERSLMACPVVSV
jgi:hypothetical protein